MLKQYAAAVATSREGCRSLDTHFLHNSAISEIRLLCISNTEPITASRCRVRGQVGGRLPVSGFGALKSAVAAADSAGEQTPAITSQKARDKATSAKGGGQRMFPRQAAEPAEPGQTGTEATPAGSQRAAGGLDAIGGLARPAKPGQTGC